MIALTFNSILSDLIPFHMIPANPNLQLMIRAQITADVFANGQYMNEIGEQYIGDSHYNWDTSRLI
jgi:hypothetical protein